MGSRAPEVAAQPSIVGDAWRPIVTPLGAPDYAKAAKGRKRMGRQPGPREADIQSILSDRLG